MPRRSQTQPDAARHSNSSSSRIRSNAAAAEAAEAAASSTRHPPSATSRSPITSNDPYDFDPKYMVSSHVRGYYTATTSTDHARLTRPASRAGARAMNPLITTNVDSTTPSTQRYERYRQLQPPRATLTPRSCAETCHERRQLHWRRARRPDVVRASRTTTHTTPDTMVGATESANSIWR